MTSPHVSHKVPVRFKWTKLAPLYSTPEGLWLADSVVICQVPRSRVLCEERSLTATDSASKLFCAHRVSGRYVYAQGAADAFAADRTLLPILYNKFWSLRVPVSAQRVPCLLVLCGVCPNPHVQIG